MLLVIDSGNTNTVFAVYDGEIMRGEWRSSTRPDQTADEYGVWLSQLLVLEGLKGEDIDAAIVGSVVPATIFPLKTLCRRYFGVQPLVIGEPGVALGIEVHAEGAGADRLINAVAAHARYRGALIVVDFGTATTFDVVDANGGYRGGCICPGINVSLQALHVAAAQLPRISIGRPEKVIGTATVPAMKSGIFWGYVSLIEGLVQRILGEYGEEMTVVATGGLAPLFKDATPVIQHLDPDLTLRGLLEIYRNNVER